MIGSIIFVVVLGLLMDASDRIRKQQIIDEARRQLTEKNETERQN